MLMELPNQFTLDMENELRVFRLLGIVIGGMSGVFIEYMALTGHMPLHRGQSSGSLDILFGALFGLPFLLVGALALFAKTGTTFNKDDMTWTHWWSFLALRKGTPNSMAGLRRIQLRKKSVQSTYGSGVRYVATIYVIQLGEDGPQVDQCSYLLEARERASQLAAFLGVELINLTE